MGHRAESLLAAAAGQPLSMQTAAVRCPGVHRTTGWVWHEWLLVQMFARCARL